MGKQFTPSSNVKDLGITIDTNLNYNDHVANILSSCMFGNQHLEQLLESSSVFKMSQTTRIITGTKMFEHVTPILEDLKYLPVIMELYWGCCYNI